MNFWVIDLIEAYPLSYGTHHEDDHELSAFMPATNRWRRSMGWGREAAMDSCSVAGVGPVLHQMYLATL